MDIKFDPNTYQAAGAVSKYITDREVLRRVANTVQTKMGRPITSSELTGLISYARGLNLTRFRDMPKDKLEDMVAATYLQKIRDSIDEKPIDVRELMIKELTKSGSAGDGSSGGSNWASGGDGAAAGGGGSGLKTSSDGNALVEISPDPWYLLLREMNRESLNRTANIWIDSRYRDLSDTYTDRYVFRFSNSYTRQPGTVNAIGEIRDVIELQCDEFTLPYNKSTDNYYNKITMQIGQFKNGYISQEGNFESHFVFNTEKLSNNMIKLTPVNPICKLRDPVVVVDKLDLIFRAPFAPVQFDADRGTCTVSYTNPATFTTPIPHNLESGDLVYVTGFTTNNINTDQLIINAVNSDAGYAINKIDQYNFNIPILDLTVVTAPVAGLVCNLYYGSKRAIIPLRLVYVLPRKNITDA